ncbi:MAG: DUF3108 domain-containing protein [Bryobacteraceae bacterium]
MLRTAIFPATICGAMALLLTVSTFAQEMRARFPYPERLSYRVEWHMITAGVATVELVHGQPADWRIDMTLESAGTVARLYHLLDKYHVITGPKFCADEAELDAEQGKQHRITHLIFDNLAHKVKLTRRDLKTNTVETKEVAIAPCTHDVLGALAVLRTMNMQPGAWQSFPTTNGKKMVYVKIHALDKETIKVDGNTYHTIRYEAYLFNKTLYKRKGRCLLWLTDDAAKIPVQFRFQFGFPMGTISVELQKRDVL